MKAVLTVCLFLASAARATAPTAGELLSLGIAEREELVRHGSREELAALLKSTTIDELLAFGRKSLAGFGVYSARLTKQERVDGKLVPEQVLELVVRDQPFATRIVYVDGPGKGRKVLYSAELRKDELRVREAGPLGLFAIWINLDSGLTRRETNHRVTDLGFGALLALLQRDVDRARPAGGFQRTDEGFDQRGAWCMRFDAPAGAQGLAGDRSRVCVDLALGVPVQTEVWLRGELLERYSFAEVKAKLEVTPDYFTPGAAGL